MSKNFLQPVRMESQFVATKLHSVLFQASGANAPVADGTIAVLGAFAKEPVYTAAFTAGAGTATDITDINTRIASAPAAATAVGVGVIDLPTVQMRGDIRLGVRTIGLSAEAGVPVRFRTLVKDDTFATSLENCSAALAVGKYAVLGTAANAGKWVPAATAPETAGCYCQVVNQYTISQGVDGNTATGEGVTAYTLLVVQN